MNNGAAGDEEERVALVDWDGRLIGAAARSVMRRERLLHAATAVFVRDESGRLYVHRRSADKDWAPSHHDACAGGVLLAGERPEDGAVRELAEELGIRGTQLTSLGLSRYEAEDSRCIEFVYETSWNGPISFADDEVVWGEWMTPERLQALLDDPSWLFVPDTRLLLARLGAAGIAGYRVFAPRGANEAGRG